MKNEMDSIRRSPVKLVTFGFLMIAALVSSASCQKSAVDNVGLAVNPEAPIVINADLNRPDSDPDDDVDDSLTVSKPWFSFKVRMNNNSGQTITVIAISLKATGIVTGAPKTTEYTFVNDVTTTGYISEVTNGSDRNIDGLFYTGSLPKAENLRYQVEGEVIGWFGTFSNPQGRFNKKFRFSAK